MHGAGLAAAWLGQKPGVAFRQTNAVWQPAMEKWFQTVVGRMADANQFATQGGPIALVQVENELPSTDLPYVAWCGTMAAAALNAALRRLAEWLPACRARESGRSHPL